TGSAFDEIPDGANAVGLAQIGLLPGEGGLDARAMLGAPRKAYILYGAEPPYDFADGAPTMRALRDAGCVIAFSAYVSDALREVADVILPIGLLPEIDATLVNLDGKPQACSAGATMPPDARAGWRVLRALGGALQVPGFDFTDIAELRTTMLSSLTDAQPSPRGADADWEPFTAKLPPDVRVHAPPGAGQTLGDFQRHPLGTPAPDVHAPQRGSAQLVRLATVPIYRADAVVRRSQPLQNHPLNRAPALRLHADDASALQLRDGDRAKVNGVVLPVLCDAAVPNGCAWIEAAHELTAMLPPYGTALTIEKAAGA
ncbi:MAG TPA: molybdopterin-dependent oxidoreductase, partial [Rhodanobacteraceae bacterium]|nr:molybdopterin-dependent oxidoreductase [Rhodanobacteraceae bacterium]